MKTNPILSIAGAALVVFGAADFASAQWPPSYPTTVVPALETIRQAEQNAARIPPPVAPPTKSAAPKETEDAESSKIPKTRLVAVGVDEYPPESGLSFLSGCVNDVAAFRNTLKDVEPTTLTDAQATRGAILKELERAAADKRYGRLVVFFACHGVNVRGNSFLCPVDVSASEDDLSELSSLETTEAIVEGAKKLRLIPLVEALDVLKGAGASEVVVILDACRSVEGDSGASETDDFMRELIDLANEKKDAFARSKGDAFVVMTSCSAGQKASEIEIDGESYGAFAYYFLAGLRTGEADYQGVGDGLVTLTEAYNYAYSKTATFVQKTRGLKGASSDKQEPEIFISRSSAASRDYGEFVLATVDADDATRLENGSDLRFLSQTGKMLAKIRLNEQCNRVGERALNCALENLPNDVEAREARAAVRRKLGDYAGALDDCDKIGQKFQLYATDGQTAQNAPKTRILLTSDAGEGEIELNKLDLLTITKIDGDRYFVSEVNNDASKSGWIAAKNAGWSLKELNGANVVSATTNREASTLRPSSLSALSSGVNLGRGSVGPRGGLGPSGATLGF